MDNTITLHDGEIIDMEKTTGLRNFEATAFAWQIDEAAVVNIKKGKSYYKVELKLKDGYYTAFSFQDLGRAVEKGEELVDDYESGKLPIISPDQAQAA